MINIELLNFELLILNYFSFAVLACPGQVYSPGCFPFREILCYLEVSGQIKTKIFF
jgi:hypothetical protein